MGRNMSFSEKIRFIRNQYHLSQEELAEELKVSRQTVSKWESGASYPEIEKLLAISSLFEVSTDYLLKDSEQSKPESTLDRLVLQFLASAQDMDGISKELIDIMRDGIIDSHEKMRMKSIIRTLDEVSQIIEEIKQKIHHHEDTTDI